MNDEREHILMASDLGDKFPLLDALLGTGDTAKYTHEELGDAMALMLLDAAHATNEMPTDPSAVRCLDAWRVRVMRDTSAEGVEDFGERVALYFERRPPNRELLAAIQLYLERKQATEEEHDRARAQRLLGAAPLAALPQTKPAGGRSWLEIQSAQHR